jgi:hypothetical protein
MAKAPTTKERIEIQEIQTAESRFNVLGVSPMIMHRFSQKAWRELLFPGVRENRASLEQRLKHDPFGEFRGAFYRNSNAKAPTLFHIPNGSFHGSIAAAALDMPGAAKAQIERLTRVVDVNIDLFGVPQIFCAMVRNSDIKRTPDVRTRPIFPQWGCQVTIRYVKNILTERTVANLFSAAGAIIGIGDWRGQKGGPYGGYKCVDDKNAEFKALVKMQGRVAQKKAFENPAYFDEDTTEILTWFTEEVKRREMENLLGDVDEPLEPVGGRRMIIERGGDKHGNDTEFVGEEYNQ